MLRERACDRCGEDADFFGEKSGGVAGTTTGVSEGVNRKPGLCRRSVCDRDRVWAVLASGFCRRRRVEEGGLPLAETCDSDCRRVWPVRREWLALLLGDRGGLYAMDVVRAGGGGGATELSDLASIMHGRHRRSYEVGAGDAFICIDVLYRWSSRAHIQLPVRPLNRSSDLADLREISCARRTG